jgi:hypothetical protein
VPLLVFAISEATAQLFIFSTAFYGTNKVTDFPDEQTREGPGGREV